MPTKLAIWDIMSDNSLEEPPNLIMLSPVSQEQNLKLASLVVCSVHTPDKWHCHC